MCSRDTTELVPANEDPMIGTLAGPWKVLKRIGLGGMGAVYEVVEVNIERRAAMKIVHPAFRDDPNLPGLLEEARAVTAIQDDGLVDVFGYGRLDDGRAWLVMELLEGEGLDKKLAREGRLSLEATVAIAVPVLSALEAAHAAGIIHRDIKPSNIFLEQRGDTTRVRILDLGLAKRITAVSPFAVGTPDYVPPEQARNDRVGPRADLYSFGCVLYEMLSGHVPFTGANAQEVIDAHELAPRPSLRASRPELPAALDTLVSSLMQQDPRARPSSALSVREALLRLRASPEPESPSAPALPVVAPPSRQPVVIAVLALFIALGAVGAVMMAREPRATPATTQPPLAPDPVEEAVARAASLVRERLDAGALEGTDSAIQRLEAAKAAWPQRTEWTALAGELAATVHTQATAALAAADTETAHHRVALLQRLAAPDPALEQQVSRLAFAQREGMVRVGAVFIDRYEHPNRAGAAPTTRVDWSDAVALCERAGKHLCSEEEWETACAGEAHRPFPWGTSADLSRCTHRAKRTTGPSRSGAAARCVTPEGVFDLSGNVAEWTSSPVREGAPQRVLRGGSFKQSDEKLGCTARDYSLPGLGGAAHIGFRCCL